MRYKDFANEKLNESSEASTHALLGDLGALQKRYQKYLRDNFNIVDGIFNHKTAISESLTPLSDTKGLRVGSIYTLKNDLILDKGQTVDDLRDMAYGEKFIRMSLKKNGDVLIKKGMKLKCISNRRTPEFMVYGDVVEIPCNKTRPLEFEEGSFMMV